MSNTAPLPTPESVAKRASFFFLRGAAATVQAAGNPKLLQDLAAKAPEYQKQASTIVDNTIALDGVLVEAVQKIRASAT